MSARISNTYACWMFSSTPSRANVAAGRTSSASGTLPYRRAASQIPAGTPNVPTDAAPMLNTWIASPKETLIGTSSSRRAGSAPRPGASTKKSSRTGSSPGGATSM